MHLKVGLFTSLGVNVGDEFIREGIRAILDEQGAPYCPLYVNKVDESSLHEPHEDESELVEDKYWASDLFIQAGAPVYWRLPRSTSLDAEWHSWMWCERILNRKQSPHPQFINLGAGSCQPWGENGDAFLEHRGCAQFAMEAGACSRLTTVRDPVAADILQKLQLGHQPLACPAFLAGSRHRPKRTVPNLIAVNLMPLGAHFDFAGDFDRASWGRDCLALTNRLRRFGRLVFVCHDRQEVEFAKTFAMADERVFHSANWRDYFDVYGACAAIVANRVHGAVCAAGFGTPAVILGTDTRTQIGEYIGIPRFRSGEAEVDEVVDCVESLLNRRDDESFRLLDLRKQTMQEYLELLSPIIDELWSQRQCSPRSARRVPVRFGSVSELKQSGYQGFMQIVNDFAGSHQLRVIANWSKVWEYPWLWGQRLGSVDWAGTTVIDLGSEISPMPWLVALMGAHVHIVETNPNHVALWEKLRDELKVDVSWNFVDSEILPFPDQFADVLMSFSVIEHQPNKAKAVEEAVRVLKPGGLLAISFDICEPPMGMTFPQWNGKAFTISEFEELLWLHSAFGNMHRPSWNMHDIADFWSWHLQSADHHNYVVAATCLEKRAA